jgi:hypothetical protein
VLYNKPGNGSHEPPEEADIDDIRARIHDRYIANKHVALVDFLDDRFRDSRRSGNASRVAIHNRLDPHCLAPVQIVNRLFQSFLDEIPRERGVKVRLPRIKNRMSHNSSGSPLQAANYIHVNSSPGAWRHSLLTLAKLVASASTLVTASAKLQEILNRDNIEPYDGTKDSRFSRHTFVHAFPSTE